MANQQPVLLGPLLYRTAWLNDVIWQIEFVSSENIYREIRSRIQNLHAMIAFSVFRIVPIGPKLTSHSLHMFLDTGKILIQKIFDRLFDRYVEHD